MKVKYEDLKPWQKEIICNGCGGKGSIITPPHAIFFETSCNHHDYGYWVGCNEVHRKICDKGLFKAMMRDCKRLPFYKQLRYRPWCYAYYVAIRFFGKRFFYYSDYKRWPDA